MMRNSDRTLEDSKSMMRKNCGEFLRKVYDEIVRMGIEREYDGEMRTPDYEDIRDEFLGLIDGICSRGGRWFRGLFEAESDDFGNIEVWFGDSGGTERGLRISTAGLRPVNPDADLINRICDDFPILDRKFMLRKYT